MVLRLHKLGSHVAQNMRHPGISRALAVHMVSTMCEACWHVALPWSNCHLTGEPLVAPFVADVLGNLYTKEAVLEFLLCRKGIYPDGEASQQRHLNQLRVSDGALAHLRSVRDVFSVLLTPEGAQGRGAGSAGDGAHRAGERSQGGSSGSGGSGGGAFSWVCPVTLLPCGKFACSALRVCGHVVSDRALAGVGDAGECPVCSCSYDASPGSRDVVPINRHDRSPDEVRAILEAAAKAPSKKRKLALLPAPEVQERLLLEGPSHSPINLKPGAERNQEQPNRASTQRCLAIRAAGSGTQQNELDNYEVEEEDEEEDSTAAQQVVRELYVRFEKQQQRWRDYRSLFSFLGFVSLFLAILYLQRSAGTAFMVYSTIDSVVTPPQKSYQSTGDVYNWLNGVLTTVWTDPVCGDGVCEAPFEYASYSHFGCRADCGKLQNIQNLTTIQIDLYYDFTHPVGSIPRDLMQQASWNLCPNGNSAYATSCYFATDNTFGTISGEQHYVLNDAPDGNWDLEVKRDIFDKVQGAVRDTKMVYASGFYYKVFIATISTMAEQNFETSLLQQAIAIATTPYLAYLNTTLNAALAPADATYNYTSVRTAFCLCGAVASNGAVATTYWGDAALLAMNASMDPSDSRNLTTFNMTYSAYAGSSYCSSPLYLTAQARGNSTDATTLATVSSAAMTQWCTDTLAAALNTQTAMNSAVQSLLIDQRLGDQRTTGKVAVRNSITAALRLLMANALPELLDPAFNVPSGTSALADPVNARVDILQQVYIDGPTLSTQPQKAYLNLTRSSVYNLNITMVGMWTRSAARILEIQASAADTAAITLPAVTASYNAITVETVTGNFVAAGGSRSTLPSPDATGLGDQPAGVSTSYNLAIWHGNATAYLQCDLGNRGSSFVGTCVAMNVSCAVTSNDTTPYNCTNLLDGNNATISGNLSSAAYANTCEMPCDRKLDCDAICECFGTCGSSTPFQTCECDACMNLNANAAGDVEFLDIRSAVSASASGSASIAGLTTSGRRRLQDTNITAQLSTVLTTVGGVVTQQSALAAQMAALGTQVSQANSLAAARARDTTLLTLIQAGRDDIATGQAQVQAKLDKIIGMQTQALAAATAAARARDSQVGLSVDPRSGVGLVVTLVLWKRTRRDKTVTLKAALLANVPCTSQPLVDNTFSLNNGNAVDVTAARDRTLGLTNRVIGGMLLHQTRSNETACDPSKFDTIQQTCTGPETIVAYGIDPVFKSGTVSYNGYLDDANGTIVLQYYNCSLLPSATYNLPFLNTTVNLSPYCAELFNPQNLPYAFHFFPLDSKEDGFPVWFDINLGAGDVAQWFTWVQEGLYLDPHTRELSVEIVTYNAPLKIFSYFQAVFEFSEGGSIDVTHRLNTVKVEVYDAPEDWVRLAFEILLSAWICAFLGGNLWLMAQAQTQHRNALRFFTSGWNVVEFISNGMMFSCMIMWWVWVRSYAKAFDISIRYDVYLELTPTANFLALSHSGDGMSAANNHTQQLRELVDLLNLYFVLNGINILLLIARVLMRMDFQPRLGVVTRSLRLAGPDLLHFAMVAGMVFIGYAMMAHLIFGNAVEAFQTFGSSINCCFEILLGNIDVNKELRALGGLQSAAGALFFWSYELLVFMVLLNFLLAIIVDAFSETKDKTHETVSMHTELYALLRDKWCGMIGRFSNKHISDQKLGALLKAWAGEDAQDTKAIAPEDAQKLLTVLNEDVDEATLRDILTECLDDATLALDQKASAAAAAKAPKGVDGGRLGLFARMFGGGRRRRHAPRVSPEEIAKAAKYIIDRFGAVPVAEEPEDFLAEGSSHPTTSNALGAAPPPPPDTAAAQPPPPPSQPAPAARDHDPSGQERDHLAAALARLADVQRELADGQRSLMAGQRQLAEQQVKLVALMNESPAPPAP
ncbi:MAG: hypothetical protein WDW38_003099 [Sanguina aurantia]